MGSTWTLTSGKKLGVLESVCMWMFGTRTPTLLSVSYRTLLPRREVGKWQRPRYTLDWKLGSAALALALALAAGLIRRGEGGREGGKEGSLEKIAVVARACAARRAARARDSTFVCFALFNLSHFKEAAASRREGGREEGEG